MTKDDRPPGFYLYVDDLVSDGKVESMTTRQFGAYVLLLCKAWREDPPGSVPNDDRVLARWSRLTPDEWSDDRTGVLSAFVLGTDDRWHQKRMRKEFAKAVARKKQLSLNATRAASVRWHGRQCAPHAPSTADALPEVCLSSSLSTSNKPPPPIRTLTTAPSSLVSQTELVSGRPVAGLVAGGDIWTIDSEAQVRLTLKVCQYNRHDELIVQCRDIGLTPKQIISACQEYQANRDRFDSPGAIAEKLRTGHWPADGVVTIEDAEHRRAVKQKRTREQMIQNLRFRLIKSGHADARDAWNDQKVIEKALELGIIQK